jgi:hypothetical protein
MRSIIEWAIISGASLCFAKVERDQSQHARYEGKESPEEEPPVKHER